MTFTQTISDYTEPALSGTLAVDLMCELATWEHVTVIILHAGSVFEFKGRFPLGSCSDGFYNLKGGAESGFEGHINIHSIDRVGFQEKMHRGRVSYAFTFQDKNNRNIFKVFLGRDAQGELIERQVRAFFQIKDNLALATI